MSKRTGWAWIAMAWLLLLAALLLLSGAGATSPVEAQPNADLGWASDGWNASQMDHLYGPNSPTSLNIEGDRASTNAPTQDTYTLTVSLAGTGSGNVSSDPAGIACPEDCTELYAPGTVVTLTAMADTGSTFSGWEGDCTGASDCPVTIDAVKSVTATFTLQEYLLTVSPGGTGSGSVSSDPAGIACPGDCTELYTYGTVVTLTATADTGSTFSGWGAPCSGTDECVVTIDAAETVVANFTLNQYLLTVSPGGTGSGSVSSDPVGIACPGDCTELYTYGTVVTLTATADTGSTFSGWGAPCSGTGECVVTIDAAKTVVATFEPKYTLTVTVDGPGSGSVSSDPAGIACPGDCSEPYTSGTVVTLTATADAGSTFVKWSGACKGGGDCVVTMDAAQSVTAKFGFEENLLTVSRGGNGSGSVSSNLAGIACPGDCTELYTYGTEVTLTATEDTGSTFSGWGGACSGTGPCVVTIDAAKTVVANFTLNQYLLTVSPSGSGSGSVSSDPAGIACPGDCTNMYGYGTVVTLMATAGTGSSFSGWGGACSGTGPCVVTIDAAKTVFANFTLNQYPLTVSFAGTGSGSVSSNLVGIACPTDCSESYTYGTVVTLTAAEEPGSTFSGWGGACSGTGPCVVTIDGPKSVIAAFTKDEYFLTIFTVGTGSVSRDPDQAIYYYGDVVDLTPETVLGWSFADWSGPDAGDLNDNGDGTWSLTMDEHKTVTATFARDEYFLTINLVGSGSVVKDPDQATYHYGDVVELTPQGEPGWTFSDWSGPNVGDLNDIGGGTWSITMDEAKSVTATFTRDEYLLTITEVGSGSVRKDPDRSHYHYGYVVVLTPEPVLGWSFGGWSGPDARDLYDNGDGTWSLTFDGHKTLTATFTRDEYNLTIYLVGSGNVIRNPDQATYHYGNVVELTPQGEPGWPFVGWSGPDVGDLTDIGGGTWSLTMNEDKVLIASFVEDEYILVVNVVGSGTVSKDPDQATYNYGDLVELEATAVPGWAFSHWSVGLSGTDNPISFTIEDHTSVTAVFVKQHTLDLGMTGTGSVILDPAGPMYDQGTVVTLTPVPDDGWIFHGWSGPDAQDLSDNGDGSWSITMDGPKNITANFITRIHLPMVVRNWPPLPDVPTLYPIDNPEGLRTYTVSWSSVADEYILEEARNSAFSGAVQIYVGSSTSHVVSGQMTGRYYYRVKSRNLWAESGWSGARSADVRWEVEPNDQAEDANGPIVSGLTYYGTFPGTNDIKDYFYFDLTTPHRVQIWLTNIPTDRNYDLVLRRSNLEAVAYSLSTGNADEYIDVSSLPIGRYYVQVYRTSGAGSSQPYHLRAVYE